MGDSAELAAELSLAAEVIADHRLVDAGLLGDRPHRHAVVAALGEELGAGGQQRVARGGGVAAAGAAASDSSCGRHLASSLAVDSTKHMVNYETCQAWE